VTEVAELFRRNRAWAESVRSADPGFFSGLAHQQAPEFLWIGCSDSRVPANQITGLAPGEVFVHRNIANLVVHTDLNCLSVLQFGIDLLRVRHIVVCGHYGCSGVRAALANQRIGIADNWLRHLKDVRVQNAAELDAIAGQAARERRLCELNVLEQVRHVCDSSVAREAWSRGQAFQVHGWIYDIEDGLLRDLGCSRDSVSW
jgi:carbonic anhydrase